MPAAGRVGKGGPDLSVKRDAATAVPTRSGFAANHTGPTAWARRNAHRAKAATSWPPLPTLRIVALFVALTVHPVGAAEPSCRELEQNYEQTKSAISSVQRNAMLFAAAARDCAALANRLIAAGASVQARDRAGAMPLAHAARGGHVALVERLLAEGAPIDARDLAGATALYAAAEAERPATVAALLARRADPNLAGRSDVSPLAAAAFRGNDRIVELLLARGAAPDHVDATGKTPMIYAAARGFAQVVRRLLDAGVDARARYGNDLTALMWAAGHEDGVGAAAAGDVTALLIAHGAIIDAADNRGRTAVMIAAERGNAAMVERLLARGADRTLRDKAGNTARDLAANDAVRAKLDGGG
jgi:ankyrin repeat protein